MVLQIILADILLVARIFPRACGPWKNTTQLVKYPRALSVKSSNKVYLISLWSGSGDIKEASHGKIADFW